MFNAIVIFSTELSEAEIKRARDFTSAESVSEIPEELGNLSEFGRIVLGNPDLIDVRGYIFKKFSSLSFLIASDLRPVMFFQDEDGILDTLQKYGEIASMAEHCMRPLDVARGSALGICEGKRQLGLSLNKKIVQFLVDDIRHDFKNDFDDIVQAARDYYSVVSQVEV